MMKEKIKSFERYFNNIFLNSEDFQRFWPSNCYYNFIDLFPTINLSVSHKISRKEITAEQKPFDTDYKQKTWNKSAVDYVLYKYGIVSVD